MNRMNKKRLRLILALRWILFPIWILHPDFNKNYNSYYLDYHVYIQALDSSRTLVIHNENIFYI